MITSQHTEQKSLNRLAINLSEKLPIKIVQFGEGNFLRAFIGYAFQRLNDEIEFDAGIAVVQPIEKGLVNLLNQQDGLYTLFMNGIRKGEEFQDKLLISNIVQGVNPYEDFNTYLELAKEEELEFIISNTTEAGIAYKLEEYNELKPADTFPGKLTQFLYTRFQYFQGNADKGLTIIPCELINHNADTLRGIILKYIEDWDLGEAFKTWMLTNNSFHNTLVDRIVPGYPRADIDHYNSKLPYVDKLIVTAETFLLWVIEGDERLKEKLPFHKLGMNVKIVDNMQPYRTRKVRILNGAHTGMVPFSLLFGNETVKETIDNDFTGVFIRDAVFDEIIPTLDMDKEELRIFADDVLDRFRNPFIKHQLADIALNSIAKFKVRVLPSLLAFESANSQLPINLTFSFACLIRFYQGEWKGKKLPIKDSEDVISMFNTFWNEPQISAVVEKVLGHEAFWGQNLNLVDSLTDTITLALEEIEKNGIKDGYINFRNQLEVKN
ncbi:tagaturonate reductase [Portibacter lacus]|uniref:Altronate oxidoreductase n=1 Tax=Portibacter lacus TaxID=1099794 RepID=A0AA37SK08_9BACT|nr:tagaturonate reductase [Portibacter lacus]GLR15460.1 altronate oxidoreductase [Portibacter lacus]